jgi:hypothetical protein
MTGFLFTQNPELALVSIVDIGGCGMIILTQGFNDCTR